MEVLNRLPEWVEAAYSSLPVADLKSVKRALRKLGGRIFSPLIQPDLCRICRADPALFHELMLETMMKREDHIALNLVHPGIVPMYESLLFPEEFYALCQQASSLLSFRMLYERMMDDLSREIRTRRHR
jgi:hypothetical protein